MIEYWFMFPVAILISTIAMMSGIGGAILFSPFFMLVLKLEPLLALASGLFIELFGFSSGVIGYLRKKAINFHIVKHLLAISLVATVIGVFFGRFIDSNILKLLLAALLLFLGYNFLFHKKSIHAKHPKTTGISKVHHKHDMDKTSYELSFLGGLLVGMISSGLGEVNEYNFLRRLRMSVASSSATSVFMVACSAAIGVFFHFLFLAQDLTVFHQIGGIILFAIPGVIIGAQIGVALSTKINKDLMSTFLGFLFCMLCVATVFTIL